MEDGGSVTGIKDNRLFKDIKETELDKMLVCSKSVSKSFSKGKTVFYEGEASESIYVLLKGRVAAIKNLASGRKNIIYEINENNIFGEHSFFGEYNTYKYEAKAITDIDVLEIKKDFFSFFCEKSCGHHRQLVKNLLEILAAKEWLALKKLNIVSTPSLKERIAIFLLDEADEKGRVVLKMDRETLADYLGVQRPSLSRSLMQLQEAGIIEAGRKEIVIKNIKKLEEFCI